jgi:chromosome segregation ATPase
MVSFMREEREEAKAERAEMEAKLESKLAEQKAQMEAKMDAKLVEQKAQLDAKLVEQKADLNGKLAEQKAQMGAKLAEQEAQTQQQQAEALKARELASAMSAVSEGQLELLQTRLDALHEAKLLTDNEIGALEDCVADYIDCCSSLNPAAAEIGAAAEKVKKMVGLSERMGKDGMLARQLRRKFVS